MINPAANGPITGPRNGAILYTAIGLRKISDSQFLATMGGEETDTYFPISADVKRSLRLPPVTERNAAPKRPVMKRKTMRTTDGWKD